MTDDELVGPVDGALAAAQDAKAAYRNGTGTREQHRQAATELRYQRWIARGGPGVEQARLAGGGQHSNREVAALYDRWMTETLGG